jgi:uncharacterized Zn finger protein
MWGPWDFKPSRPRQAKGGIKAQSKRGGFGASWWAKRWIAVLESFDIGARLGRGRSYARQGQVLSIQVEKGLVKAKVQGSRPKPYDVAVQVKTLNAAEWESLIKALARQAIFAAKLLAGEMPDQIEEVFKEAGLSLFPTKLGDLGTKCSCPDWSNPCKHIAAVYYLLGEEFDRDPFLIFTLRGMTREELMDRLGDAGGAPAFRLPEPRRPVALPEPMDADPAAFWGGGGPAPEALGAVEIPPVPAGLPKRLGGFPFWRGAQPFLDSLEPIYARAAPRGLDAVLGQQPAASAKGDATATSAPASRS